MVRLQTKSADHPLAALLFPSFPSHPSLPTSLQHDTTVSHDAFPALVDLCPPPLPVVVLPDPFLDSILDVRDMSAIRICTNS